MKHKLEVERVEHNKIYARQKDWLLEAPLSWDRYYEVMCVPPHLDGSLYGMDHRIFLDFLAESLKPPIDGPLKILDYGCGTGGLALALASRGFQVEGFDLSDTGIEIAKEAAQKAGLADRTNFITANAQALPYADGAFDLVIGKAVLHHTIKYEGTENELFRILKKGGKALFFEGAAGNPLIALARTLTIKEDQGDVPLSPQKIRAFSREFSHLSIEGYFFLYMFKRFGYYSADETLPDKGKNKLGKTRLFQWFLSGCLALDQVFINQKVTRLSGRYLIQMQK